MVSESELIFMNIKELGGEKLYYDRAINRWITGFYEKFDPSSYDVLVFNPISNIDWCRDGPSQGFNYQGKIFFCLELHNNPINAYQNEKAIRLMTHKLFHGLGYNHQNINYKQYIFLDWDIGMPELLWPEFPFDRLFFSKHVYKTLGVTNKISQFEKKCLDLKTRQFTCKSVNGFLCADSWGPFCYDIDQDGIVDSEDDYVFSSPKKGIDSDGDGIIDDLDLCGWNKIEVLAENAETGPMKIVALKDNLNITFESKSISIKKIVKTPMSIIYGLIRFPEKEAIKKNGNMVTLNSHRRMWRIEVFYSYKNKGYYRPYYVYFPGFDADFFYDREWYYFNRFGCDIPLSVDFADLSTYDPDATGLPDKELFEWAGGIGENYDWDNDGIPDIYDTLPTVPGDCSNNYVKGVPDWSGDGFCAPGILDFSIKQYIKPYEIAISYFDHPFIDLCPHVLGSNQGCP